MLTSSSSDGTTGHGRTAGVEQGDVFGVEIEDVVSDMMAPSSQGSNRLINAVARSEQQKNDIYD
jgi:hypothetical protein